MKPISLLLIFLCKSCQHFTYIYITLEGGNKLALFIIERLKWQTFYFVEGGQKEFDIPAHFNIRIVSNLVLIVKVNHFIEWLIGYHHDLVFLQLLHILFHFSPLVFAMVAIGAEIHNNGWLMMLQLILG